MMHGRKNIKFQTTVFKYNDYIIFYKLYHLLYGEVALKRLITIH